MENQVPEPDCILKVSVCTCNDCSSKLRKFFLKMDGVKAVGLIREKNFVLIRGDADPIGLLHALQLKGEEGEIMYYRKPDLADDGNQTPDNSNIYRDKKTSFPKHFNSAAKNNHNNSAANSGSRRYECRVWNDDDDDEEDERSGARESYPGHVRESYVAGPAHAPKECSQTDCPFHDHYLKSVDHEVGPAPPPVSMGFYGGGSGGYSMRPPYGFPQRPPPPPWGYGYGPRMMM